MFIRLDYIKELKAAKNTTKVIKTIHDDDNDDDEHNTFIIL